MRSSESSLEWFCEFFRVLICPFVTWSDEHSVEEWSELRWLISLLVVSSSIRSEGYSRGVPHISSIEWLEVTSVRLRREHVIEPLQPGQSSEVAELAKEPPRGEADKVGRELCPQESRSIWVT